ncbi:MAG: transposase [Xanthomonadaceae bacterium]|nr:transposase [Xanthomonadaceae bacterium]
MPRRARIAVPGIPWHIIQRGNNRSTCFHAPKDYRCYLATLREQAEKHGCSIHAYVLMTNHVHLLLTPVREDSAALLMKHLGQRYVQYFNRSYRRTGTLWEGRFRSCLARDPQYVLGCYRYIELNPVRAGMVRHPGEYLWSSYHANARGVCDPLITPHEDYRRLGRSDTERRASYEELFVSRLDPEIVAGIRRAANRRGKPVRGQRPLLRVPPP